MKARSEYKYLCLLKNYRKFVDHLPVYVHTGFILFTATFFIIITKHSAPLLVHAIIFTLFSLLANFYNRSLRGKYILAIMSFASFFTAVHSHGLPFNEIIKIAFYMPLIYAYLLPDTISPLIAGAMIAYVFSTYLGEVLNDYVIGNIYGIIYSAISYSTIFFLIRKLTFERDEFHKASITDSLTGLSTFTYSADCGQKMLDRGCSVIGLVIDLDRFKQINDTYGHLAGNKILIQFSSLLKKELSDINCIIGRLGGDEFIVFIQDYNSTNADKLVKRLRERFDNVLFEADPDLVPIKLSFTVGVGYSFKPSNTEDINELLHRADMDMYYNKYGSYKLCTRPELKDVEIPAQYCNILDVLAEKDMYTYVHSQYTAVYAAKLARALRLSNNQVQELYIAGLLHDLGKIYISNNIIRKPGRLMDDEYYIIKNHVEYGLNIIEKFELSDSIRNAIKYHHERYDGKGYPFGIAGNNIPIEGRIMQIADTFSAITVKRVYRNLLSEEEALMEIRKNSGTQFDPQITAAFVNMFEEKRKAL